MIKPPSLRATAPLGLVVLALAAGACAPPNQVKSGLNVYSTDIVLGAPPAPVETPRPPLPQAKLQIDFPSFIAPSPPRPKPVPPVPPPPPPPPPPVPACPQADLFAIPDPAAVDITAPPAPGVYSYRQEGTYRHGDDAPVALPTETARTLQNVEARDDGTFTYEVAISQLDATTTTTYELFAPEGFPESRGIYLTRTVMVLEDGGIEEFAPLAPGLLIFPLPAGNLEPWQSVAPDPIHGTTMTLDGQIVERSRVDACGTVVEGWLVEATIAITHVGGPDDAADTTITAKYVVVPQLGGLIASDDVEHTTTRGGGLLSPGIETVAKSVTFINDLDPAPLPPEERA